jgi:hypothetical protein
MPLSDSRGSRWYPVEFILSLALAAGGVTLLTVSVALGGIMLGVGVFSAMYWIGPNRRARRGLGYGHRNERQPLN